MGATTGLMPPARHGAGRPERRHLAPRARPQEAPLPLRGLQEGGPHHGVQGVRAVHLAPRRAQCRLLRQQRAAQQQQNEFRHEMVLMSAVEKPTEVSSLPRPTAAGTPHTSIQSVRGEGRKEGINLIQM